jgi:CYTH domain-containing protein
MSWEIERRYLVRVTDTAWRALEPAVRLRQGYVVAGPTSVRIRSGEPRGFVLNCKRGAGVRRREVEAVVPADMAEALFEASGERVIEKLRHRAGPWEVDRFLGPLGGLALLEIELEHEDDEVPEPPNGVSVLREVTDDNRFTSSSLASLSHQEQRTWVKRMYEECAD